MESTDLLNFIAENSESIFEDAHCGFIFTRPNGKIIKANRTFLKWLNISADALIDQVTFQQTLSVGSRIYYDTNYAPLLKMQGALEEISLDLESTDKKITPVLVSSVEMKDADGKTVLIKTTLFNISERRRFERELIQAQQESQRSKLRVELLFKVTEEMQRTHDFKEIARHFVQMATEDFCDGCAIDLEAERLAHDHRKNKIINDELETQSMIQTPIIYKNNSIGSITFVLTEFGRRFVKADEDLAEELSRRLSLAYETSMILSTSLEKLYFERSRLDAILNQMPEGVSIIDTKGKITLRNARMDELRETFRLTDNKDIFKQYHGERPDGSKYDSHEWPIIRSLKSGEVVHDEEIYMDAQNGSKIIISNSASPVYDEHKQIIAAISITHDITKQKVIEQKLIEVINARDEFMSIASHELNTPLTSLKLQAQMRERKLERAGISSFTEPYLKKMISDDLLQIKRLGRLIDDMLDISRIKTGKLTLQLESFDLCILTEDIMDRHVSQTEVYTGNVQLDCQKNVIGHWDRLRVEQVITNLLTNAIRYGDGKDILVKIYKDNSNAVITVQDQGIGIAEENLHRIFDRFERAANVEKISGLGLGLYIVKQIVEMHQGIITVESVVGQGSKFEVTLPL